MRSRTRTVARLFALCIVLVSIISPISALTDEEIFRDFRFNFANPGARALGMGGAFIAIANDATAAQAQPGRMPFLERPQLLLEYRSRDVDNGETGGDPFQISNSNPRSVLDLTAGTEPDTTNNISYVSFVYPVGERITVGISRQSLLDVKTATSDNLTFVPVNYPAVGFEEQLSDASGMIDANLLTYTLSGGFRFSDYFSVGASLVYGTLDLKSEVTNNFEDIGGLAQNIVQSDPLYEVPGGAELFRTEIDGSDTNITYSFGLYMRTKAPLQFGIVYKKGPRFTVEETRTDFANVKTVTKFDNIFHVPDITGFGVAYSPFLANSKRWPRLKNLRLVLDIQRIEYRDLLDGFVPQQNILTDPAQVSEVEFTVDNQTEVRLGIEYRLDFGDNSLFLRAGGYTDPDNQIRLASAKDSATTSGGSSALLNGEVFPGRQDETHLTLGLGFFSKTPGLAFDLAADMSDTQNQFVLTAIYEFPEKSTR